MKNLIDLEIGENVFFLKNERKPYQVKAKKENYLIATVEDGDYKRYTIIDVDNGVCAPHDRIFNPYDFTKQEDIEECLDDIITGKYGIKLSQRHGAKIEDVLDIDKTIFNAKSE